MAAVGWVMSNPKRWALALRGGRLARVLGRRRNAIGDVPLPVVGQWTEARDLPRPPRQTFRDWWAQEHGGVDEARGTTPLNPRRPRKNKRERA
jgi:L-lactate dehydrogenase complex protein LldF